MIERLTPKWERVEKISLSKVNQEILAERTGGEVKNFSKSDISSSFEIHYDFNQINEALSINTEFITKKGKMFVYRKKFGDGSLRVDSGGYLTAFLDEQFPERKINIGFPTEIRQYKREDGEYDTFFVLPKTEESKNKFFCFWVSKDTGIRYITNAKVDEKESEINGLEQLPLQLRKELIAARRLYSVV